MFTEVFCNSLYPLFKSILENILISIEQKYFAQIKFDDTQQDVSELPIVLC